MDTLEQNEEPKKMKLFEQKSIRTVWDEKNCKWWYCIADVAAALTDTKDAKDYLKKLRKRDSELSRGWKEIATPTFIKTAGGGQEVNFADNKGILRIIETIASQKAEPFKQWMAEVAAEMIAELDDPKLTLERALWECKRLGYSDDWINQRLQSVKVRDSFAEDWQQDKKDGQQFSVLADLIAKYKRRAPAKKPAPQPKKTQNASAPKPKK